MVVEASTDRFGVRTKLYGRFTSLLREVNESRERNPAPRYGRANPTGPSHRSTFGATNETRSDSPVSLRSDKRVTGRLHQPSSDDERGTRTRTSVQASNLDRLTGQPSGRQTRRGSADSHFGASELTHRTGSPVTFGRRTNHGAIHQPPSGSKRIIGSASLHFDAKLAVPGRAHQSLRCQTSCGSTSPLVP